MPLSILFAYICQWTIYSRFQLLIRLVFRLSQLSLSLTTIFPTEYFCFLLLSLCDTTWTSKSVVYSKKSCRKCTDIPRSEDQQRFDSQQNCSQSYTTKNKEKLPNGFCNFQSLLHVFCSLRYSLFLTLFAIISSIIIPNVDHMHICLDFSSTLPTANYETGPTFNATLWRFQRPKMVSAHLETCGRVGDREGRQACRHRQIQPAFIYSYIKVRSSWIRIRIKNRFALVLTVD